MEPAWFCSRLRFGCALRRRGAGWRGWRLILRLWEVLRRRAWLGLLRAVAPVGIAFLVAGLGCMDRRQEVTGWLGTSAALLVGDSLDPPPVDIGIAAGSLPVAVDTFARESV